MKVVFVSCVKEKLDGNHPAKELYVSKLFQKSWAYALTLKPDKIYILSAKYGLLDPNQIISSYDKTLIGAPANERKNWAKKVIEQMKQAGLDPQKDEFIILAGKKYYEYIRPKLKHVTLPYEGKRLGETLQFLNNILKQ